MHISMVLITIDGRHHTPHYTLHGNTLYKSSVVRVIDFVNAIDTDLIVRVAAHTVSVYTENLEYLIVS